MAIQSAEEFAVWLSERPDAEFSQDPFGNMVKAITARDDAIRAEAMAFAADKAREYAAHYSLGSDGNNTFTILADWFEHRARAQAAERESDYDPDGLWHDPAERAKETGDE